MNALIIAAYGIYVLLVGIAGNSNALVAEAQSDAPGFVPWAVSIAVLAVINEIPATHKLAAPFLTLLVLTFFLRNFETLREQFRSITGAN